MSTYDETIMTTEDKEKIKAAQDAYKKALAAGDKNGMNAAHDRAEAIRKAYGYSGGADGAGYTQIKGYEGAETLSKAGEDLDNAYSGIEKAYKEQAEKQKADVDTQTDETLRQAYISNMQAKKGLDQNFRASGVSGGLSETVRAGMEQNYQNNRISVQKAAGEAKKDIDINLSSALAQNNLNRANARNSSDVTKAQFQQSAADSNRNIKYNEKQLEMSAEQQNLSKYMTLLQNGIVDSKNAGEIAKSLNISTETAYRIANDIKNSNYTDLACAMLQNGVYDDSFVEIFGNKFSAETIKQVAERYKENFYKSSNGSRSSSGENDTDSGFDEMLDSIADEVTFNNISTPVTVGNRGNTGNGGVRFGNVIYSNYKDYVMKTIDNAYLLGNINETQWNALYEYYEL